MRVLFIGDVMGRPGRRIVRDLLPALKDKHRIDFTVANGENLAGGIGLTPKVLEELLDSGVDVATTGNHVWKRKDMVRGIDQFDRVLRPANYPAEAPGRGSLVHTKGRHKLGVINLQGRVFMNALDCPFRAADREIEAVGRETNIILVDMHAEATSEKRALGWYLDGKVSAVVGTHTHVQTADETILPWGTGYITDVGMTGGQRSVIGIRRDDAIGRFLSQMPVQFEVAAEEVALHGVVIEVDAQTGKTREIVRLTNVTQA